MTRLRTRAGFALPMTIFLIAFMTLMLTAALVRVQADRRIAEGSGSTARALGIAQGGLQNYMDSRSSAPADGDSVRYYLTGGYADVIAQLVQRPADTMANRVYVIRSTGYFVRPTLGAEPQGQRTVAQFARWQRATMNVQAAFTAANGLKRKTGGSGEFRGNADPCGTPNIPGIRTSNGGTPSLTNYPVTLPPVEAGTAQAVADGTNIDWRATTTGGLVPHYTYVRAGDFTYPIQLVTGDASVGATGTRTSGTGLLIVTGDLRMLGTKVTWLGIVLVGGQIVFDADTNRIEGAVISGLNEQLGTNVAKGQVGGNVLNVLYNSCYVTTALASLKGMVAVPNAWVDHWASY